MKIEVRLFAHFREGRNKKQVLELGEGTTILTVLDKLNIDENEVKIALINGRDGALDRQLQDGDILSLFPPVGGG
ncbi:MAG TPA: MoaD/ThiS family protein [Tepidimicrobium sp.]|nr:MoaD/ThiS family protein [Tepidimicrobium sp.]